MTGRRGIRRDRAGAPPGKPLSDRSAANRINRLSAMPGLRQETLETRNSAGPDV